VLNLCLKDPDAGAWSIRVLSGKGGRTRTVGIDAGALAILAAWSTYRAAYPVRDGQPLFCTRSGRAVTTAYIRRLLPHLAGLAGIAKRVHAHGLRHTHAAELRGEGVDIGIISKQLGLTGYLPAEFAFQQNKQVHNGLTDALWQPADHVGNPLRIRA
jgi:site-specific recombinase XerD